MVMLFWVVNIIRWLVVMWILMLLFGWWLVWLGKIDFSWVLVGNCRWYRVVVLRKVLLMICVFSLFCGVCIRLFGCSRMFIVLLEGRL